MHRYCKEKIITVNRSDNKGNFYVPQPGRFLGSTDFSCCRQWKHDD